MNISLHLMLLISLTTVPTSSLPRHNRHDHNDSTSSLPIEEGIPESQDDQDFNEDDSNDQFKVTRSISVCQTDERCAADQVCILFENSNQAVKRCSVTVCDGQSVIS